MKLKTAQQRYSAFTLVELLIVIALLGVIATIVISAINPIEQANRATDAGMKADASQLLSAIQRYYATHNIYPWEAASCSTNSGTQCLASADLEFPFLSADDASVGVCGANGAGCRSTANVGELIAAQELTNSFLSKSWIGASGVPNELMVGKATGASSGVYVCWIPKSSSNRQNLINSKTAGDNKMVDITGFTSAGIPDSADPASVCTTPSSLDWGTGKCYECVPE
jgi:prepilin-type N-terminal cleavage/methylation domain-containing protein